MPSSAEVTTFDLTFGPYLDGKTRQPIYVGMPGVIRLSHRVVNLQDGSVIGDKPIHFCIDADGTAIVPNLPHTSQPDILSVDGFHYWVTWPKDAERTPGRNRLQVPDASWQVVDFDKLEPSDLDPAMSVPVGEGPPGDKGDEGDPGLSAYQVAVANGFTGTVQEWLETLRGPRGYATYVHTQTAPSTVWTIVHGLNRLPVDSTVFSLDYAVQWEGYSVQPLDEMTVRLGFDDPTSGIATII